MCIALPIYLKVKQHALGVKCVMNLRSLGLGFGQYCMDNRNTLPHHDDGSDIPPSGYVWYKLVLPYLLSEDENGLKYMQETGYDHNNADFSKVVFSYKMNSRLEDYKGNKGFLSPAFREISTIHHPAKTVLIFDGRADKKPYSFQSYGPPTYVEARHCDKAGILFLDWSVKLTVGDYDENGFWKNGSGLIWDPDFDK